MKVVVIGTGLGGVGAVKALVGRGIQPIVLDVGTPLPPDVAADARLLRSKDPQDWSLDDVQRFAPRDTVGRGPLVPRKSILGSEYFYGGGDLRAEMDTDFKVGLPPYSEAIGGFSAGWGGAFLPIHEDDMADWPIEHGRLIDAMRACVADLAIHEPSDDISRTFPSLGTGKRSARRVSRAERRILTRLEGARPRAPLSRFVVGQSRLLTDFSDESGNHCRYCGRCSSGCVFGSIYKTSDEIEAMIARRLIDYRSGLRVERIDSGESGPVIRARDVLTDQPVSIEADRVFVAMGAVQSSVLYLRSMNIVGLPITIRRTGGFVQPLFSMSRLPLDWPEVNTQSSIFAEFKVPELSNNWVHAQISPANELVLGRIGINGGRSRRRGPIVRTRIAEHLAVALVNIHSSLGPDFEIRLQHTQGGKAIVESRQTMSDEARLAQHLISRAFLNTMRSAGFPTSRLIQQGSFTIAGFHFGASLPMSALPTSDFDTDTLGRPAGWSTVHFVDTSVLPSIPATTVGLLAMANAYRIASESVL